MFASRDINWQSIDCLAWHLTAITGPVPELGTGRTDSFVQLEDEGVLYYLGGPAHLVNAACDNHANCEYKLKSKNSIKKMWAKDFITKGEEITALYGFDHRPDLFCHCGSSLLAHGQIDQRSIHTSHVKPHPKFKSVYFNPLATADYVESLSKEYQYVRKVNDELRRKRHQRAKW